MTKILKIALQKAGFEETKKIVPPQFKILHIPTASFLMELNEYVEDMHYVVANRAMAFHILDNYRTGAVSRKASVSRNTINAMYFLEDDLLSIKKEVKHKYQIIYRLKTHIHLHKMELRDNPLDRVEFELIPV
jgi:hypothetical protein